MDSFEIGFGKGVPDDFNLTYHLNINVGVSSNDISVFIIYPDFIGKNCSSRVDDSCRILKVTAGNGEVAVVLAERRKSDLGQTISFEFKPIERITLIMGPEAKIREQSAANFLAVVDHAKESNQPEKPEREDNQP